MGTPTLARDLLLGEAKVDNARLRAEVARLGKDVERLTPRAAAPSAHDEMREKILLALAECGEVRIQHLAMVAHAGVEATKFHVEKLFASATR